MNILAKRTKSYAESLLDRAGIRINGPHPWDIRIHDERTYVASVLKGSIGLGESYMNGWWDCERLDEFFERVLGANLDRQANRHLRKIMNAGNALLNLQNRRRSKRVARQHYDIGNELYKFMLDKNMNYSCGYWKDAKNLDEAQEAKLDLVCKKIGLTPGMKVLDIGCGWGGFAKYAAVNYGTSVDGITISREQTALAQDLCKGLPVRVANMDYRDLKGEYDRIVSIGMFEHVGRKNYRRFFEIANRCLKDDGLLLLHTIGCNSSDICRAADPWVVKYIFPSGIIPSVKNIGGAYEDLFVIEDWHNFGPDYDRTLMAWHKNINEHWDDLPPKYDTRFRRMWNYYLLSCAASFRSRWQQLWQIVFSKDGIRGGYRWRTN